MNRLFAILFLIVVGAADAKTPDNASAQARFEEALELIHAFGGSGDERQRAMQLAEALWTSDPDSGYSQTLVAESLSTWELGQDGEPAALRDQIIQLADQALQLDPSLAQAHVAKARALVRGSMYDQANAAIDAALALQPDLSGALFLRADIFRRTGNYAAADAWYRRFIDSTPSPARKANGYGWMAKMYTDAARRCAGAERAGHLARARALHERLLELDPASAWKTVNFAIFLNDDASDFDTAEHYAQKALAIMEFPMARYHVAAARYQKLWAVREDLDGQVLRDAVARVGSTVGVSLEDAIAFEPFSGAITQRLRLLQTYMATAPARTAPP